MYRPINQKRGAIELSIGTVVIIVLAMSMLILGLVLIRTIFTGATDSVEDLGTKVQDAIADLFVDEDKPVVVLLGPDQTAKIKPSSDTFGVAVGAQTEDGSSVGSRNRLQYKITLDAPTTNNCVSSGVLGLKKTEDIFLTPLNEFRNFEEFDGPNAFARIELNVPKGTQICSQKVLIDVRDTENNNQLTGGTFFRIDIVKEGIF